MRRTTAKIDRQLRHNNVGKSKRQKVSRACGKTAVGEGSAGAREGNWIFPRSHTECPDGERQEEILKIEALEGEPENQGLFSRGPLDWPAPGWLEWSGSQWGFDVMSQDGSSDLWEQRDWEALEEWP